jgi:hypothetical protein
MYNMLFGVNPNADQLLALLDATKEDFGRFRDVYVNNGYIVVHTRCGGGNREDYFPEWVEDHPWYSHDADDDFDCTYADIFFKLPPEEKLLTELMHKGRDPAGAWKELLDELNKK